MLADNPIVNSPFEEPTRYWDYQEGQPVRVVSLRKEATAYGKEI